MHPCESTPGALSQDFSLVLRLHPLYPNKSPYKVQALWTWLVRSRLATQSTAS